ncbi:MAG: N-acetylmuramoyl-L-alanine amidase [Holosporales bacterium]|jgi:N-acetyl-anhydromuramyl-L-alanine amidase AmpD|nr:N-acetylmuramoyl-L-alanine amidase [Holosporales bacterium]
MKWYFSLISCLFAAQALCMKPYVPLFSLDGVNLTYDHLDNSQCTAPRSDSQGFQVMYRLREDNKEEILGIVVHYTAGSTVQGAIDSFRKNGVSAHFMIDEGGETYFHVDPKYIAFHAGASHFAEMSSLNKNFLGIEHVSLGFKEEEYPGGIQVPGDNRYWFPYPEEQIKASAMLINGLQKKYHIAGYNILGHADIAPGRKSDPGPLFPYKKLFNEFGVGYFFTETHPINLENFAQLTDEDHINIIKSIGYTPLDDKFYKNDKSKIHHLIQAYQMHFAPECISGKLENCTKRAIIQHVIDLYNYVDQYTGEQHKYFRNTFDQLREKNPGQFQGFSEFI